MNRIACAVVLLCATTAPAQWTIQESHTTADLRGIHALGNGIAWASGTDGAILRTPNDGKDWQRCTTPPDAEHLDFRGIQAFDATSAVVMSSGKGPLSRLYKTTDACRTWKLVFTNPDPEGFWDAVRILRDGKIYVFGDPSQGQFALYFSEDAGQTWFGAGEGGREPHAGEAAFAASNSSFTSFGPFQLFGTGGAGKARVYHTGASCSPPPNNPDGPRIFNCVVRWNSTDAPITAGAATAGIFALATRELKTKDGTFTALVVAVGGDYAKPEESAASAAVSSDGGNTWILSATPPHGFRSSVAYDTTTKTWITVGPNGTDVSTDDGRNWRPLRPAPTDAPDADQHWNALSLPFVVGPHGRIGKLNPGRLKASN